MIAGLDAHLSTSVSRYSVNHYLTVNGIATRNQVSEIMVNSPKVNLGYFDSKEKKFEIQEKLGDILKATPEQIEKASKATKVPNKIKLINIIENFSQQEKELEEDKVIQNMTKEEREEKLALVNAVNAFLEDTVNAFREDKYAHLKQKPLD